LLKLNLQDKSIKKHAQVRFSIFHNEQRTHTPNLLKGKTSLSLESKTKAADVKWEIVFPLFRNPVLTGLELEDGSTLEKVSEASKKVYVAIGDSITQGVGQVNPSDTWPWAIAEKLDMELYNCGIGGSSTSHGINVVNLLEDWDTIDLITILWGYNAWVYSGATPESFKANYTKVLNEVRKHHPNTPIVCLRQLQSKTTESKRSGATYNLVHYREVVSSIVEELKASGDQNIYVIQSDTMTNASSHLKDAVHPNPAGAKALSEKLIPELKAILAP
jgi:lysophospholipase L1-like esterase